MVTEVSSFSVSISVHRSHCRSLQSVLLLISSFKRVLTSLLRRRPPTARTHAQFSDLQLVESQDKKSSLRNAPLCTKVFIQHMNLRLAPKLHHRACQCAVNVATLTVSNKKSKGWRLGKVPSTPAGLLRLRPCLQ